MNIFQRADSFEFDDNHVFYQEIETMLADVMILEKERNCLLSDELNTTQRKFNRKRLLIN